MQYDPLANALFTDEGQLIKRLHCPKKIRWKDLKPIEGENAARLCTTCDRDIIDTAFYDDEAVFNLLRAQPDTCLKINLNQDNLKIIMHGDLLEEN